MSARGPDGAGQWFAEDMRIGLGHRRLSIIDLSHGSDQPMISDDGRYVIVFNGEIYNYVELRDELECNGSRFRTSSDTEVIIHLYALSGADMLQKIRGMYAIAIWDTRDKILFLARDPYGIKPLYTSNDGRTFRFASQVKALLAGGMVSRELEPAGVVGFHLWGYVPEPFTLYRDIRALPSGHFQIVDESGPRLPQRFANLPSLFCATMNVPPTEISSHVRNAVLDSVSAHLVADVEVGLFLSAGVDSCSLLGLMNDAGQKKTRAITLAFEEFRDTELDESLLAADVARLYGAEHIIRYVTKAEFNEDLDIILDAMDQPSIDGINTWFVAKAAREAGLKVAISGVGGDELLAGYPSFIDIPRWNRLLKFPASIPYFGVFVRTLASKTRLFPGSPKMRSLLEYAGSYSGAYLLRRGLFLPHELRDIIDEKFTQEGLVRLNLFELLRSASLSPDPRSPYGRIASLESTQYMRNMLLRDADWAGMAHSIEIRTPLVDFNLLKALGPIIGGYNAGDRKRFLAAAPETPLPSIVSERAKSGFEVPIGEWMTAAAQLELEHKGLASRAWARRVYEKFVEEPSDLRKL